MVFFFVYRLGVFAWMFFFELVYTFYGVRFTALLPYVKLIIYIVCFLSSTLCIYYHGIWQILLIFFVFVNTSIENFFSSSDVFFIKFTFPLLINYTGVIGFHIISIF